MILVKYFFYFTNKQILTLLSDDYVKWRSETLVSWTLGKCNINVVTKELPDGLNGYGYLIDLDQDVEANNKDKDKDKEEYKPNSDVYLFPKIKEKLNTTIPVHMIFDILATLKGPSYSAGDPFSLNAKVINLSWDSVNKIAYVEMKPNSQCLRN
jgi:hypothetical protein